MKHILRLSAILLSAFLLSACDGTSAGDDNNAGGEAHNTGYRTELYGAWKKSCFLEEGYDHIYMTKQFHFSVDGTFGYSSVAYSDSMCKESFSYYKVSGTYVAGGQATDSAGEQTTKLDLKVSSVTIDDTVHSNFDLTKFYTMYKKSDSDHLLVADYEKGPDFVILKAKSSILWYFP